MLRTLRKLVLLLMAILTCLIMTGCPIPVDRDSVSSGEFYRSEVVLGMHAYYGVDFQEQGSPDIRITYKSADGLDKTTEFKLDGYDPEKLIGYKLVTLSDVSMWKDKNIGGSNQAPEISDVVQIQQKCVQYDFPVIFISSYLYQDDKEDDFIFQHLDSFRNELEGILNSVPFKKWASDGLYDGTWIRDAITESYRDSIYKLNFLDNNPPTVTIAYGEDEKAVFQLDGYDPEKRVGYKFVTEADKLKWETERNEGNDHAPDLSRYQLIQASALDYEFPVVFYYYPNYWESRINTVIRDPSESVLPKLKAWLQID